MEIADEPEPAPVEDGEPVDLRIAYEDDDLLVVDKPAGVVVHPAAGHATGTLVAGAGRRAPGSPTRARRDRASPGPRHQRPAARRAADEDTLRALQDALRERRITREYLALVEGRPPARTRHDRRADRPRPPRPHAHLDRHRRRRATRSPTSRSSGRCPPRRCCACASRPAARTRSARTSARSATPSAATANTARRARCGLERQFLHAARLAFDHPVTGEPIEVCSPLPPDLRAALSTRRPAR